MENTAGPIEPMTFLNRDIGKMSRGQEEVFIRFTKLVRSWCYWRKLLQDCRLRGAQDWGEGEGKTFKLMSLILLTKKERGIFFIPLLKKSEQSLMQE